MMTQIMEVVLKFVNGLIDGVTSGISEKTDIAHTNSVTCIGYHIGVRQLTVAESSRKKQVQLTFEPIFLVEDGTAGGAIDAVRKLTAVSFSGLRMQHNELKQLDNDAICYGARRTYYPFRLSGIHV